MQASSDAITFLFTDIEGSTKMWEQDADRMSHAVAGHDALVRTAVEAHRGRVVKTTGDGIYAAFPDALDSVQAVIAFQIGLTDPAATAGLTLRVRCGLHAGPAVARDNDYFGTTINRTGRIMGVAHGGQVLLSRAVADLVQDRLPPGVSLRDLGGVRLKDLSSPEQVCQLVHPQLRQDFPALRSLETTPNNLPEQLTTFIGREREVTEASKLLAGTRLLTLLGMGGLGKTRLSLQIAADALDANPDGVWFLDLAPIRDPSLVPNVAAQVLGVREEPGKSMTQTLCAHVKSRKLLLILDNCEHLMGACADFANALLRVAPGVRILATSREALRIPGEQVYPVYPLTLPDRTASVETLSRSEAVQLFMDRAQLQKPGFALTEKEAPAVAELCARLEGIPLALELAAARMRSMSIQDINKRLNDRFKLLTGGGRVLMERQQTLRALVAWSYDMLREEEQWLLERLSIFAGGFDLEAAEAICGADPLTPEDVLDLLTSLVEKSLVMVDEGDDGTRYRQLETIREFAREYLNKRDDAAAIAMRHCDHFLALTKAANKGLQGHEQAEWTRRLEAELDNVRAGIALALGGGTEPIVAVKFGVALMSFWIFRGYSSEGRNTMRAALALPGVQQLPIVHAHALYVAGVLADNQSDYAEARRLLSACLELRRELGDPREVAATLSTLSTVRLHENDAEQARTSEEEALGIFRELGDRIGEAIGLLHLGEIDEELADTAAARRHFEQCLALALALKHRELEGECERNLGELALRDGDLPAARTRFERSLKVFRAAEDKRGEATSLWWTGKADIAAGDGDSARERLSKALVAFQAFEMNAELLGCLEDHAGILQSAGLSVEAIRLYGAADAARERLLLRRPTRTEHRWRAGVADARNAVGEIAFDAAWEEGSAWEVQEATRIAFAHATKPTASA